MPLVILRLKYQREVSETGWHYFNKNSKAKMRMKEAASGIDCQETKLDKLLEEIIEKEKAATDARSLKDDNKKTEKVQQKSTAAEQLSVWVKPRKGMLRNKTKKSRRQRKEEDRRRKWCNFWKKRQKERVCWERRICSWDERSWVKRRIWWKC